MPSYPQNNGNDDLFYLFGIKTNYYICDGDPDVYWAAKKGLWAIALSPSRITSANDLLGPGIPAGGVVHRFVEEYLSLPEFYMSDSDSD